MGDDDATCVEHDWVLTEIGQRGTRLDQSYECSRCPAVSYVPAPSEKNRPPL